MVPLTAPRPSEETLQLDLATLTVRELNHFLHHELPRRGSRRVEILHPQGRHNLAVGLTCEADVHICGHAGYFVAGMNQLAHVTVHGNVGWSVAENMMSGIVRVCGSASACAGASAHGGLLIIEGDAGARCGISLKGADIVVQGSVGHMSAFMAQAGRLVVCGDAAPGLGDSLYEAVIYVRGTIHGLGADARLEPMTETDLGQLRALLERAGFAHDAGEFQRIGSARTLYHWNADAHHHYG
jgi:glutamate synthase domain-containing protein 3